MALDQASHNRLIYPPTRGLTHSNSFSLLLFSAQDAEGDCRSSAAGSSPANRCNGRPVQGPIHQRADNTSYCRDNVGWGAPWLPRDTGMEAVLCRRSWMPMTLNQRWAGLPSMSTAESPAGTTA